MFHVKHSGSGVAKKNFKLFHVKQFVMLFWRVSEGGKRVALT